MMRLKRILCVMAAAAFVVGLGLVPAVAQDAPVFVVLGTDAEGDDADGYLSPQGVGVHDTTESDDILELAVATVGQELQFLVKVKEMPADGDTTGQICWMPAFEVVGQVDEDGAGLEYVALVCATFTLGEFDEWVVQDTNRGTEVASSAEFVDAETAVLVHVPLENLQAGPADVLRDVYVLTYHDRVDNEGQLYVDDVLPDAKSDRDAADNLGCYVIGSGLHLPDGCDHDGVASSKAFFEDLTGPSMRVDLAFADNATSDSYQYNWTAAGGNYTIAYNADAANGSVALLAADASGGVLVNETFSGQAEGAIEPVALSGPMVLEIAFAEFVGSVSVVVQPWQEASDDGGPPEASPSQDDESGSPAGNDTGNQTRDDGGGVPGFGALAAAAGVGLALVVARRRRA